MARAAAGLTPVAAATPLARIHAALGQLDADLARHAQAPVFLIGSTAARLAGALVEANDLDLLAGVDDAARLEQAWAARRTGDYEPADGQLFRSRFARYAFPAMPVEVMGGLEVCVGGVWRRLAIGDAAPLDGHAPCLHLPSVAEQLRVLALFGRAKDRARAALLRPLLGEDDEA
jgi:hypothetical protein